MFKPLFMADEKPKRQKMSSGGEVLQALFENGKSALSVQFIRWKLWKKWSEYVGPTMAAGSEPVGYYNGILYVCAKSSAWMQQLVFMREPMRDVINKKLQQEYVKEIRLTMDRKSVPGNALETEELKESISSLLKDYEQS
jgi:predicted nucleic acid-binding Zn ribbon protein